MNKADRKVIADIIEQLEKQREQSTSLAETLRTLADAEQEKFDNMSEGLQNSERGQDMENAANCLSTAADACESGNLGEAIDELNLID